MPGSAPAPYEHYHRALSGSQSSSFAEREGAGHRRAFAHHRGDSNGSAMQLDERAHQRETEPGAAMMRAERMGLEPIEHLLQHVGRNPRTAIGDREGERVGTALGDERDGPARR